MIWNFFDRAVLISLPERADRRVRSTRRLRRQGIEPVIMDGVLLDDIFSRGLSATERGGLACACAHFNAILKAKQDGLKNILIFEDDVVLRDDASKIFPTPPDHIKWDLLYLGADVRSWCGPPSRGLRQFKDGYQTHAYAVNSSAFAKVLRQLESSITLRTRGSIDTFLLDCKLFRLCCWPMLALQEPGHSDITGASIDQCHEWMDVKEFTKHCKEWQS